MTAAIVLAAGLSRRMGRFKLTLPWGDRTVIGQVVATLEAADVNEIIIVTGHRADEVAAALADTTAHAVHNPDYAVRRDAQLDPGRDACVGSPARVETPASGR